MAKILPGELKSESYRRRFRSLIAQVYLAAKERDRQTKVQMRQFKIEQLAKFTDFEKELLAKSKELAKEEEDFELEEDDEGNEASASAKKWDELQERIGEISSIEQALEILDSDMDNAIDSVDTLVSRMKDNGFGILD